MLPGQDCGIRCGRRVPHLSSLLARGLCCLGQTVAFNVGVAFPTLFHSSPVAAYEGLMLPGQDCGIRCGRLLCISLLPRVLNSTLYVQAHISSNFSTYTFLTFSQR
jgi:hypothetical protein